jgi:hypothetical protein
MRLSGGWTTSSEAQSKDAAVRQQTVHGSSISDWFLTKENVFHVDVLVLN